MVALYPDSTGYMPGAIPNELAEGPVMALSLDSIGRTPGAISNERNRDL